MIFNPVENLATEERFRSAKENADCQHPEYWHSKNCSATEIEVSELIAGLVRGLQPDLVLETGTYRGYTAYLIAQTLVANGHGQLVTLDNHIRQWRYASRRLRGLPVRCILTDSLNFRFDHGTRIDFAFFDSDQSARLNEFEHFQPWFHQHTVLCWHDTGTARPLRGWLEGLAAANRLNLLFLPTARGICIARPVING